MALIGGIAGGAERAWHDAGKKLMQAMAPAESPDPVVEDFALGCFGSLDLVGPDSGADGGHFVHTGSGCRIVADCRLDNRAELADILLAERAGERDRSDAELILRAYLKWGEGCGRRLIGDFGFAVWDPNRRTLLLCRDSCGVKPLYYRVEGGTVLFGSALEGLLAPSGQHLMVDDLKLAEFITGRIWDFERTFWQGIQRVRRGCWVRFSEGGQSSGEYYRFDTGRRLALSSEAEWGEGFREVLAEAVRCRLPERGPISCALSGGLDSSSVTCLARKEIGRESPRPLQTYSCIFEELEGEAFALVDERQYMDAVVAHCGTTPHFLVCDRRNPFEAMQRSQGAVPGVSFNIYMHETVLEAAAANGARVYLEGEGGDSTLSYGTHRFYELGRSLQVFALFREVAAWAERKGYSLSPRFLLKNYLLKPKIPEKLFLAWSSAKMGRGRKPYGAERLLAPTLFRRWREHYPVEGWVDREAWLDGREVHVADMVSALDQFSLEEVYRIGTRYRIDIRLPFHDRRVMEFALAAPFAMRMRDGYDRYLLRSAMRGVLPEKVRLRPGKAMLSPNLMKYILRYGENERRRFFRPGAVLAQYVDIGLANRYWQLFRQSAGRNRAVGDKLYTLFALGRWLERQAGSGGL